MLRYNILYTLLHDTMRKMSQHQKSTIIYSSLCIKKARLYIARYATSSCSNRVGRRFGSRFTTKNSFFTFHSDKMHFSLDSFWAIKKAFFHFPRGSRNVTICGLHRIAVLWNHFLGCCNLHFLLRVMSLIFCLYIALFQYDVTSKHIYY